MEQYPEYPFYDYEEAVCCGLEISLADFFNSEIFEALAKEMK